MRILRYHHRRRVELSFLALGTVAILLAVTGARSRTLERPPAAAGKFYPAEAPILERAVRAFLQDAVAPRGDRPIAIVVPHAGYIYSGQIAADAYRQAMGQDYDVIVILGTNHTTAAFHGVSVYDGTGYRTPLGVAPIDGPLGAALRDSDPAFTFRPEVHDQEHSIEVQIPFVQVAFPGVKIVAAVVGEPDPGLCSRFGRALAKVLAGRRALIVASSDLSHYPAYDDAVAADRATLTAIAALDPVALRSAIDAQRRFGRPGLVTCACGEAPVLATIEAARALGARRATVISYANSGDTAVADRSRVVGYGAVVFAAGEPGADTAALLRPRPETGTSLTTDERRSLVRFARASIERFLWTGTAPLARNLPPALCRGQGVFVTLEKKGELRGCIGHTQADYPLGQEVGAMALRAAFDDRRFPPLRPEELPDIEVEISLLTPMIPVGGPQEVVLGRDGVMLTKNGHSALFLPQVAVEQGWSREELMRRLCAKAGLSPDEWRTGAVLQTFRTEVVRESDFR